MVNFLALFSCSTDSTVIGAIPEIQTFNFSAPVWDFIAFMSSWSRVTGSPAVIAEKHSRAEDKQIMQWGKPLCRLKLMF